VQELQTTNITSDWLKDIPVSNLETGIYLVQLLLNQKEMYSAKILIVK
jgi:hypothetical protein